MKSFKHTVGNYSAIFENHEIEGMSLTEIADAERIYESLETIYENEGIEGIINIDEGLLSKIIGGAAGFVIGPSVGKIIARALGVQKGLLYDMLTSRLVGTALGSALSKAIKK